MYNLIKLHIRAAPLSPAGQEFFDKLVANLAGKGAEETTEATATEEEPETPPDTEPPVVTEPGDTIETPTEAPTDAPATEAPETEAPKEGCGSTVAFAAVALMTAAAAFTVKKKD